MFAIAGWAEKEIQPVRKCWEKEHSIKHLYEKVYYNMKRVFIIVLFMFLSINCNNDINQSNSISETTFNVKITNMPSSMEYDCNDSIDFKIDFTIADSIYVYPFYIRIGMFFKSAERTYEQVYGYNLYTNRGSIYHVMPINEIESILYEKPSLIRFDLGDWNRRVKLEEIDLNVNINYLNCDTTNN